MNELIRIVAQGIGMALFSEWRLLPVYKEEMSAAMSQMSQGMGDICPIGNWDQRGCKSSKASGATLLLRGAFGPSLQR